jgi:hypothetical protein
MMPSEIERLRELEGENGRLNRIVADVSLDKEMLQDIIGIGRWRSLHPLALKPPMVRRCADDGLGSRAVILA